MAGLVQIKALYSLLNSNEINYYNTFAYCVFYDCSHSKRSNSHACRNWPALVDAVKDMMPTPMGNWLQTCYTALVDTNAKYPFLAYGYDWLAFAHFVIALSFIGPLKDPVKNSWIIDWQIMCCIAFFSLALIAGPIRKIPIFHIVIDCCFSLLGIIPLLICRNWIKKLEATT